VPYKLAHERPNLALEMVLSLTPYSRASVVPFSEEARMIATSSGVSFEACLPRVYMSAVLSEFVPTKR
jgi:hypothetical protein